MWKPAATAAAGKAPSKQQKWVPKGSEGKAEGDDEDAPDPARGEDEPVTSPLLLESSTGPHYDRLLLLRIFQHLRATPGAGEAEESAAAATPEAGPAEAAVSESLQVALEERPADEHDGRQPGARRALREQKKAEKVARRRSSAESFDDGEAHDAEAGDASPGGQKIALSQELQPGSQSQLTHEAALMMYLHNMAFAGPPVPMYAGGFPGYTTVMLRNIPNRYSRDMLIERLNKTYEGQYDFVYLPIDFNSKCNVGYAFINFRTPPSAQRFMQEFHGTKTKNCLPGFSSAKVCEVSYARVQGREANMENLRDEKFIEKLTERPDWQPLFYDDDGKEIPFAKTLGTSSGAKKRGSRGSIVGGPMAGGMTPMSPTSPGGFMMPTPYGPMMYPNPFGPPMAMPTSLSSVLPDATEETMLMLRGVPNSLTRDQFVEHLNGSYSCACDFLYLPGGAKGEGNRGFAFINFRSADKAGQFAKEYNGVKVSTCFPSEPAREDEKACEVQSARFMSIEKSIERLQTVSQLTVAPTKGNATPAERSAWHPVLIGTDGTLATFPLLTAQSTGVPSTLRPVPSKALDSRALERKMTEEVNAPGTPSKKAKARTGSEEVPASPSSAAKVEGATPSVSSEKQPKTPQSKVKSPSSAAGAGMPVGFPGPMPGAYQWGGYPGYPGMPHPAAYAAVAQMSHAAAVARAHLTAQAAAAKHAGARPPTGGSGQDAQSKAQSKIAALRKQIEFYFSVGNLCKDTYLRSHMDESGWTSLELIAQFPQVKKHKATMSEIAESLADSIILEVDSNTNCTRLTDAETRNAWAKVSSDARDPVRPSQDAAKAETSQDTATTEAN
mmetsp:Transcript_72407/g.204679  ORF Transcript_72407/g.204679 Transcript_72407/m.204679 type:complete len:839 (+) Transcript_72407:110-2626(+)